VTIHARNFTPESDHDEDGHGTHFAGIVLCRDVDGRRIGIARGVERALIGKVIGAHGGATDALVQAIQWAVAEGADVIAISLALDAVALERDILRGGSSARFARLHAYEAYAQNVKLFERLIALLWAQAAFSRSVTIVAAAGNDSRRTANPPEEISARLRAAIDGVIAVAALASDERGLRIAPFSNGGAELAAPGSRALSARRGGGPEARSGTGTAAAHVTGVAALLIEKMKREGVSGTALASRLTALATYEALQNDPSPSEIGAGLVQVPRD
jgi:subtilisin family serine protease